MQTEEKQIKQPIPDFESLSGAVCACRIKEQHRELLRQSLFYYCAGKDPTPIAVFGAGIPLHLYSDKLGLSRILSEEFKVLAKRLAKLKIRLIKKAELLLGGRESAILSELEDDRGERFFLLYVQGDSARVYNRIYGEEGEADSLDPKGVCNLFYEMDSRRFSPVEARVEFVLGYCFSPYHRLCGSFPYLGDYGGGGRARAKLFKKADRDASDK